MSQPQDGMGMDEPFGARGGSVRRARERAQAGLPRERLEPPTSIPRLPIRNPNNGASRPQAPAGLQSKDGNIGLAISRPTPVPQWPLAGPLTSPASSEGSEPYRPPAGRAPPQRPPRPSRVPSILDASKVQDHTPVFQYTQQDPRLSEISAPETPVTPSSRSTAHSSVGSIPDFPLPVAVPPVQSRRSVTLGPPPSSRRGQSSFYSTVSYVSPIPEESPRTRSHTSYASSAAIPESYGTISPGISNDGNYYDDIAEESVYSDDADESRLVRSASIGRKSKPSLVTMRSSSAEKGEMVPIVLPIRPMPKPQQQDPKSPFPEGTGFIDGSSGSSDTTSSRLPTVGTAVTTNSMLGAFQAASASDPSSITKAASPQPFRLSALRRPPRLDIDAVRAAEARGSLTSLPDLIKRATRLASMMDRGKRPASRFDDLDFPEEIYADDLEKHQSGLSDMLAAFPPPAQANMSRRSMRQSTTSWPLAFNGRKSTMGSPFGRGQAADNRSPNSDQSQQKKGRRCCGLPLWGFLVLMFALLVVIAAAIIVPLEFFVIQKRDDNTVTAQPELSDCQNQLSCANGGTNVVTDGVCSCICTNGFTGNDCTTSSSAGCTTTSLTSSDSTLSNVTLGQSIPRLIQEGQTNFSLPLSATTILSKFNSANLSCVAENALVTFDGSSTRSTTIIVSTLTEPLTTGTFSTVFATTLSNSASSTNTDTTTTTTITTYAPGGTGTSTGTSTITSATSTSTASPTSAFSVTDQVLDFARVAVLFVLQSKTVQDGVNAQSTLQKFFTSASSTDGVTIAQAQNVSIGGSNTVDLVNFKVNV
ncbi:hypothetical protein BKA67DRAFT_521570 [Truncatella angustata]|uniref:EGF-like domain-containing protein n=1 Tax=Truncatella angustata TaxID=152316 RepID=A0A9P8ZVC8_9PEZI|nr:uncharacterized protein BKA67DRAFT_521570 [Truncatella angustata]KAH6651900.1 hypothetical protein BKA67DRAFT_521570 [Truncatella angustata]